MSGVRISVRDLSAGYGIGPVLRGVTMEVQAGEVVAVCGPNGAGKTTLLRCLVGVLRPMAGNVLVEGRPVWEIPPRERARIIAYLPQHPICPPQFPCGEVVRMGRYAHTDRPGDLRAVRWAMERTNTIHLWGRPFGATSGGERQRVLLARAIAQQARVFVLDEPTAHLDLASQPETLRLLLDLRSTGATVICALHDLNLAALACDQMVLLAHGRIHAQGAPQEVITPSFLREVYGVEAVVIPHPQTHTPVVLPPDPGGRACAGVR